MKFDIVKEIGAVTREVASREHEGKPARVVVATRTYNTDIADAWEALTSAERIPRWFLPITGELRLGGRYQLQGNAGGTITTCDPPKHLALTWEMRDQVSWVDVKLFEEPGDRTRLVLEHIAHIDDGLWTQFGPGAVGIGWDLALVGLGRHLEEKGTIERAEAEAWMATPEAKDFMERSNDGWCRASIACGTPADEAKAAAARTIAAYTGGGDHH
jgi:uncharacterized protein YndB with AHSA1/START domain